MAKFKYRATTSDGSKTSGVIEAPSTVRARDALGERSLRIISLKEKKGILQFELSPTKVSRIEIMHFSRQLAAFIRAGVPILDAIRVISEESDNKNFSKILAEMEEGLRGGDKISAAAAAHPNAFPPFYVSMLKSAEQTGQLDIVLEQVARYIEREVETRRKIRSALTYPTLIFVVAMIAVVVLTAFVLPRFKTFFESLHATLPLVTRMLLAATGFVGTWWWAILAVLIVSGLSLYFWHKLPSGRRAIDSIMLKLPAAGVVVQYSIIERVSRMLGSLIRAGVPLPEAMVTVAEASHNSVYAGALNDVRDAMLRGEGIAKPITATNRFPATITQMVRVGEDTGTLDDQLETAAKFFEEELDYKLKRLTTLFEPAMILLVGVLVGFVAIALVSAMYGIFRQVGQIK